MRGARGEEVKKNAKKGKKKGKAWGGNNVIKGHSRRTVYIGAR